MKVILAAKHGTELELGYKTAHLTGVDTALLAANVLPGDVSNLHADLTELMASKEYKAWANPAPPAKTKTFKTRNVKTAPKAQTSTRPASTSLTSHSGDGASKGPKAKASPTGKSTGSTGLVRSARKASSIISGKDSSEAPQSRVNAAPVNERPRTGSMTTAEQDEAVLEAGGTIIAPSPDDGPPVTIKVRRGRPRKTRPTVAGEVAEG